MGLLSLFYRELPKLGMCKGKYRHCAVRLKIFGVSTWQPGMRLGPSILGKGRGSHHLARSQRPATVLVALEYLDLHQKCSIFDATSYHSMLITQKIVICRSQPYFARNADVHHNLNVSNPVPKVYTIYDKTEILTSSS